MKEAEIRRFNRRRLVRALGAGALAFPFLRTLPARAEKLPRRTYFLMVTHAQGTVYPLWTPTGGRLDFALGPILRPLERHKKEIVLIEGLPMASLHHRDGGFAAHGGFMHLLVGRPATPRDAPRTALTAGGRSLDQHLADHLCKGLLLRSLHAGVMCSGKGNYQTVSYNGPGNPNPARDKPDEIYQDLFGTLDLRPDAAGERAAAMKRRIRGSVVAFVHREFSGLRRHLGVAERRQLDSDLQSLADIEKSFQGVGGPAGACRKPEPIAPVAASGDTVQKIAELQLKIIVHAFACDLTRVATLSVGDANSYFKLPGVKMSDNYHEIAHRTWGVTKPGAKEAAEELAGVDTWFHERFATFIDRFKEIATDGGTLLDDSLILFANALGHGGAHTANKVPFIVAGRAGGKVKTGQYLSFPNVTTFSSPRPALSDHGPGVRCHNDLLVTIAQALGLDMPRFGLDELNRGPISEMLAG